MMKISYLVLGLVLAVLVEQSVGQWRGNVCSSVYCAGYRYELRCAYRTWNACCSWRRYAVPIWRTRYFCCSGWTTSSSQNCNQAICNPPCRNGGKCVRPNQCQCPDGAVGPTCNTLICNYQRPCFPGFCIPRSSSVNCDCSSGFTSPSSSSTDYCRELEPQEKPIIWDAKVRMSFWQRGTGMPTMEKYALYVDSTNSTEIDFIWTNRRMFNWVNVTASAQYERDNLPVQPTYIKDYGIGIAQAEAHLFLEKIPFIGANASNSPVTSLDMTLPCSPEVSHLNPTSDTYMCNISKPNFDKALENGDKLTITFKAWSGGYRRLQRIVPYLQDRGTQNYTGPQSIKKMAYYFDFLKPTHICLTDGQCQTDTSFHITEDITKNPLTLRWSDWSDVPSGMHRYAWEVFKLEADGNHVLKEPDPLGPIHGPIEVNQTSSPTNSFRVSYRPTRPGVYSFILEASDKANNSIFVRRIALYDPSSSVTTDSAADRRLFISSANPNGSYNWQQDPARPIEVTWTNHFANLVHEAGEWLNRVLKYPPQLEDFLKNIPEGSRKDDHEGQRTVNEIPNRRGIVRFEIAIAKDSNGGQGEQIPSSGWRDVLLNETFTIDTASLVLTNRDTVTVWVRATDVLGNTKVDSTKVSFDNTPPEVDRTLTFQKNKHSLGVPYSSSIDLTILDMESGLKKVDFTVIKAGTSEILNSFTMPFPSIPERVCKGRPVASCYCPKPLSPECYDKEQTLAISNCNLWVEKELGDSQSVHIKLDFMNMAGLITTRNIRVDDIKSLNGTALYHSPTDIRATDITGTTATVRWSLPFSCYNRSKVLIHVLNGGQVVMTELSHSSTSYDLVDLEPGTTYTIKLVSQYGEIRSESVTLDFDTAHTPISRPVLPEEKANDTLSTDNLYRRLLIYQIERAKAETERARVETEKARAELEELNAEKERRQETRKETGEVQIIVKH